MGVNFDGGGIDHQPLKIRIDNEFFKQFFPDSLVSPADKSPVSIAPSPKIGRQIAPWRTCSQNPKNGIDKPAIVLGTTSPNPLFSTS